MVFRPVATLRFTRDAKRKVGGVDCRGWFERFYLSSLDLSESDDDDDELDDEEFSCFRCDGF